MAVISGHGAQLGFGTTTTWTPQYTQISGFDITRESLDSSYLDTTGARTKRGGDLYEISPFTASFFIQPDGINTTGANAFDDILFDAGEVADFENVTITYPPLPGFEGATCAQDAYVLGLSTQELVTNQLAMAEITVLWKDWPTFTEGAEAEE